MIRFDAAEVYLIELTYFTVVLHYFEAEIWYSRDTR